MISPPSEGYTPFHPLPLTKGGVAMFLSQIEDVRFTGTTAKAVRCLLSVFALPAIRLPRRARRNLMNGSIVLYRISGKNAEIRQNCKQIARKRRKLAKVQVKPTGFDLAGCDAMGIERMIKI